MGLWVWSSLSKRSVSDFLRTCSWSSFYCQIVFNYIYRWSLMQKVSFKDCKWMRFYELFLFSTETRIILAIQYIYQRTNVAVSTVKGMNVFRHLAMKSKDNCGFGKEMNYFKEYLQAVFIRWPYLLLSPCWRCMKHLWFRYVIKSSACNKFWNPLLLLVSWLLFYASLYFLQLDHTQVPYAHNSHWYD